jgi:two-component system response regulator
VKKILLVEDGDHVRLLVKEELMDEGYEVQTASDGIEGLSILMSENYSKPDLIILDIRMPRMDGLDTIGHILKSKFDIPIIIHSAYEGYKVHPLTFAVDEYIVKSHDLTKLKDTIRNLLNRSMTDYERLAEQA